VRTGSSVADHSVSAQSSSRLHLKIEEKKSDNPLADHSATGGAPSARGLHNSGPSAQLWPYRKRYKIMQIIDTVKWGKIDQSRVR
jgi:hypothetical protein